MSIPDDKVIEMTLGVDACGHDFQEHQVVPKYPVDSLEEISVSLAYVPAQLPKLIPCQR